MGGEGGALLRISGCILFLRPRCCHFGKPLNYVFDALLPRLWRARLLESLDDHSPCRGGGAIQFGCRTRTKLQGTREIAWEWLLVRFFRGFKRDFDCVAGIEVGGPEHGHLQDKPTL